MTVKVDYYGKIHTVIPVDIEVKLGTNDIYNWIQQCDNPEVLRYISKIALNTAKCIEHPADDDFRSRA